MCFPSKWLKNNFSEEERPKASSSKSTKATEQPASRSADEPATSGTTVPTKVGPKTFKTAVVIYSMYGHIASRESHDFL